jgi:AraC-like DNA-binding protein
MRLGEATSFTDTHGFVYPISGPPRFRLTRHHPHAGLARIVDHYWQVEWDTDRPFVQRVLPPPAVNLVFHVSGSRIFGAIPGPHSTTFSGEGLAVGVRIRPGRFRAFFGGPLTKLTGRSLAIEDVFGRPGHVLSERVLAAPHDRSMIDAIDEFLADRLPSSRYDDELATQAVTLAATDRQVTRVDQLAQRLGIHVRSLQRLFSEHVGVTPKAVIRTSRVREAMRRVRPHADWVALASELGYSDQAHMSRDFTSLVGIPPTRCAHYEHTPASALAQIHRSASDPLGGEPIDHVESATS